MLTHLKKLFATGVNKTAETKKDHDITHTRLASAIILLEAAHADDECSREEIDHIASSIQETLGISKEYTAELIELAHETREYEVDLWQFTNTINNEYSHPEKIQIIENVWRIIFLDGQLEPHEDHFAHKLANLLRLTHKDLIDAKMKVKMENNKT